MSNINGGTIAFAPLHAGVHRKTVQLGQVARAETAQLLAGGNRLLYEMATGQAGATASHPGQHLAPPNPQGRVGVDMSGPPYGLAQLKPLWTYGGWWDDTSSGTNWRHWWTRHTPVSSTRKAIFKGRMWCKPFPSVEYTPLSRGYLSWRIDVNATSTFTFKFRNNGVDIGSHTTSSQSAGDRQAEITDVWFPLSRGWNDFALEVTASSSTASDIYSLVINNIKEYSHEPGLW